jgi:hypothetical protein
MRIAPREKRRNDSISRWLKMGDAESYSGHCRHYLIRLIQEGCLTGRKCDNGHWVVDRESIDAYFSGANHARALEILRSLR